MVSGCTVPSGRVIVAVVPAGNVTAAERVPLLSVLAVDTWVWLSTEPSVIRVTAVS